jgi:outer membrane protein assembly factor BamE
MIRNACLRQSDGAMPLRGSSASRLGVAVAAFAMALAGGCKPLNLFSVYRMEIQQGNLVEQDMLSQLKPGMSKDQVRAVLGTPLIADVFHDNRWDYVYRRQRTNSTTIEERALAVYFDEGKLVRIEGDVTQAKGAQ